jgi:hypothetical protein
MDPSFDDERSLKFEPLLWNDNRSAIVVTSTDEILIDIKFGWEHAKILELPWLCPSRQAVLVKFENPQRSSKMICCVHM